MRETEQLARFVTGLGAEALPEAVLRYAKRLLLDSLGCQLAGSALPWSRACYETLRRTRSGQHATVVGSGLRLAPDDAAFLNALYCHANESDDTHLKSPTHPGQVAVPAALALAEYAGAGGRDFLRAMVAAYEVQIRIAWACSPYLQDAGHHPPPGVGPFGGAAAAATLLGFDLERTLNAFGIAGSHAAGLLEYTLDNEAGGSVKRLHAGIAAMSGVRAGLFAEAGITGPHGILEGRKGFFRVFAGQYDPERLSAGLGRDFLLLETGLKPHACCHFIHGYLDALDQARSQRPFGPGEVAAVTLFANSRQALEHVCSIARPRDVLGAQFSAAFSLAMRLHHGGRGVAGGNGFWDYLSVDLADPGLRATACKVRAELAATSESSGLDRSAGLEVLLRDGTRIKATVPYARGLPENPLSDAEVEEKFRALAGPLVAPQRLDRIVETVARIETLPRVEELARLLAAPERCLPLAA